MKLPQKFYIRFSGRVPKKMARTLSTLMLEQNKVLKRDPDKVLKIDFGYSDSKWATQRGKNNSYKIKIEEKEYYYSETNKEVFLFFTKIL